MISEAAGAGVIRQDVQQAIEREVRYRLGEGDASGALSRWHKELLLLVIQTVKTNACLSQLHARTAVKAGATLAQVLAVSDHGAAQSRSQQRTDSTHVLAAIRVLNRLELVAAETPAHLRALPMMTTLRRTWQRHYDRGTGERAAPGHPLRSSVRFKHNRELPPTAERVELPYDPEARYRQKCDTQWTGYMVHISETCELTAPHLRTQVHTTTAAVYEAQCTAPIHQALSEKDVAPQEHFVDGAYISADVLVASRDDHDITLRGPTRPIQGWQAHTDGAYDLSQFTVDWEQR
jgi:hypothetical protein